MARILVLNGPNLNLLGQREPGTYGTGTLDDLLAMLGSRFPGVAIDHVQSNLEGELVEALHRADGACDGVVLNAGGYTHTSVALRDAVAAIRVPVVEVHLSNLLAREPFRHVSLIGGVCTGSIMGFGAEGYAMAVAYLLRR
jgi:3-dehydroquinate dehydratase-2